MKLIIIILIDLFVVSTNAFGQSVRDYQTTINERKRFIDKFEIFAGLNLSMNYGNKFIDNNKSDVFTNRRELNFGYCFGIGLYHPIKSRIGLINVNARLLFEQKGTKAKFTTAPLDTGATNNLVQTVESKYSYSYLTLSIVPTIYFGKNKKWFVSIGAYYSWLKTVDAHVLWISNSNNYKEVTDQNFKGRNIYGIDPKGGITSFGQAQGLTSFQENDYGAIVGIGYVIPFNHQHNIAIQISDSIGMQDISKQIFGATLETPPERNHTINLMICYVFNRSPKNTEL